MLSALLKKTSKYVFPFYPGRMFFNEVITITVIIYLHTIVILYSDLLHCSSAASAFMFTDNISFGRQKYAMLAYLRIAKSKQNAISKHLMEDCLGVLTACLWQTGHPAGMSVSSHPLGYLNSCELGLISCTPTHYL